MPLVVSLSQKHTRLPFTRRTNLHRVMIHKINTTHTTLNTANIICQKITITVIDREEEPV